MPGVQVPYSLRVVVQPANVQSNPVEHEVQVAAGVITEIIAQFPAGCNNTIHAVLEDAEGQIVPHQGGDIALSGGAFPFKVRVPISSRSPRLRLVAWADAGNTQPHIIDFLVTMDHPEAI